MLKKPQNVYLPIDRFQAKVFKHRDSQKRGEWVENFALALAGESKDDFAESLLSEAQYNLYKDVVRQWRFKAKQALFKELGNREPTESQIIQRCIEDYGEEFIEAFELVGKKDKRKRNQSKNPQDAPNGNAGVDRKSGTSCDTFNGDAPHSDAGDESTTVPKNMRRVPQNEAPAHGFSGGRTAQGTMSRSPEAAAQSGKAYDQVAYHPISTDEKPTVGHSLPSPSRSTVGNRHVTGDVLNLAYSGEFQNVKLTQEQYAQLGIKFGNQQKLNRAIDSLSCQIENGEKNPANHYAELVKWATYRDDMDERKEEEAGKPKMTEMEKSWIEAMKRVEAM